MLNRQICKKLGAQRIYSNGLLRVKLHHRDMLVSGCVIDDVRFEFFKKGSHSDFIINIGQIGNTLYLGMLIIQFQFDVM